MKRLGVTGVIGSGKSTVVAVFESMGVPCYNSDIRAKELMGGALSRDITSLLGPQAYIDGSLNRAFVAEKIFSNGVLKEALEGIVHPAVTRDFERWTEYQISDFVVIESAILLESSLIDHVDKTLVVSAPIDICLSRVVLRDRSTLAQAKARLATQMDHAKMLQYADFEIITDENMSLVAKVVEVYEKMTNFAQL